MTPRLILIAVGIFTMIQLCFAIGGALHPDPAALGACITCSD